MNGKRVEEIYNTLQEMKVELVSNTLLISSSYLTTTLAKCDDFIQKTDDLLTEVMREIGGIEREISDNNDIYDALFQEALQTDPEVKALGTGLERSNSAKFKLRSHWKEIKDKEADLRDLQTLQKVIERKGKRLSSAIISVKKQWDSNIDSAKYLNLNPRATSEDPIYTSNQSHQGLYEDPGIRDIISLNGSDEEKQSSNDEISIINEPAGDDLIEDLLKQL